jgi:hypothetical protein
MGAARRIRSAFIRVARRGCDASARWCASNQLLHEPIVGVARRVRIRRSSRPAQSLQFAGIGARSPTDGLHEDQMRQVAVDCRNPMKAVFLHLPRPEGTFGQQTRIGDAA